jgi:hypothetical protein
MGRPPAPIASEAYDPKLPIVGQICRDAQPSISCNRVVGCSRSG